MANDALNDLIATLMVPVAQDTCVQHAPPACVRVAPVTTPRKRRFSGCGITTVDNMTSELAFKLQDSSAVGAAPVGAGVEFQLDVLREGKEQVLASYGAASLSTDGFVAFRIDENFSAQPTGYYVGNLHLNGQYCFSLRFRIRPCEVQAVACRTASIDACVDVCVPVGAAQCDDQQDNLPVE